MIQILGGLRSTDQFPVCSSRLLPWLSGLIVVLALIPLPAAAQQNILTNASEDQVANLFSSGGPYTPVLSQNSFVDGGGLFSPSNYVSPYGYTVSGCQIIQYDCYDPAGHITSTAYDLGNGLYLYAYRVQSGSCPGIVWIGGFDWDVICLLDAVHLTVPLGGNAPVSAGGVSSGAFWIGTLSPLQADFSTCYGYQSAFTWFNSSEEWGILCEEIASDAVTSATVDNATSPTALTFTFPGINATNCWETCPQKGDPPSPQGYPYAVTYETPVFGFISSVPPIIATGQYASDAAGQPLPAFQMVIPADPEMVDPSSGLLADNPNPSSTAPAVVVNNLPYALGSEGRQVQGIAADGVSEVLLRFHAGAQEDTYTVTLQGDSNGYQSVQEDGGLADPRADSPMNTSFSQSVTVTAVNTNIPSPGAPIGNPMAFVVYRAPVDFVRPGLGDEPRKARVENLNVQYTPAAGSSSTGPAKSSMVINIVRPPVVLIHGLWGTGDDWDSFSPLYSATASGPAQHDSRFYVGTASYADSLPTGNGTSTLPDYSLSPLPLPKPRASSLGFAYNAPNVMKEVSDVVRTLAKGANPLGVPVAAAQADVVGHSMGGDIVRYMPFLPNFPALENYGAGPIHKLITIGTPHLGSPLAVDLVDGTNFCVDYALASVGDYSFLSVKFGDGTSDDGAMLDLGGNGVGSNLSPALKKIGSASGTAALIPTFALSGWENDFSGVGGGTVGPYVAGTCGTIGKDPIALALNPNGWPALFPVPGQPLGTYLPTDGVVPVLSQLDDLFPGPGFSNFMHSDALSVLGFFSVDELNHYDSNDTFPAAVINLLNTPVSMPGAFTKLP